MAKKPAETKKNTETDASEQSAAAPRFHIQAQYVKDMSFESPQSPAAFIGQAENPQLDVAVNVAGEKLDDTHYEVVLKVKATAKNEKGVLFDLELDYGGVAFISDVPEDNINALVMIEGPRLMFPFARQVVSNITREGGFLPLNLNPINFAALYRQNMEAQAGAGNGADNGDILAETV